MRFARAEMPDLKPERPGLRSERPERPDLRPEALFETQNVSDQSADAHYSEFIERIKTLRKERCS